MEAILYWLQCVNGNNLSEIWVDIQTMEDVYTTHILVIPTALANIKRIVSMLYGH